MIEKNLLDDIFSTPEEDISYFMDRLASNEAFGNMDPDTQEALASSAATDMPDKVSYPMLIEQISGNIKIQHGPNEQDYVWHIGHHPQKTYKVSVQRVVYSIAKIMNESLPPHIQAKIWLPYADWDIKEITFKSVGLNEEWFVDTKFIDKINVKIFETLNTLI
jgi:hypothetical protein